jgi:hypothetical protein
VRVDELLDPVDVVSCPTGEELEADQAAADREEGFVDVVAALGADAQPPVLVQPGDRALDYPPLCPEPRAV